MTGFSPAFLREVVRELERVQRRVDRLDERIERASRKEALTVERAGWVSYERVLRSLLR